MKLPVIPKSRTGLFLMGTAFGCAMWVLCEDFSLIGSNAALYPAKLASQVMLREFGSRAAQITLMLCAFLIRSAPYTVIFGALLAFVLQQQRHARFCIYSAITVPGTILLLTLTQIHDLEKMGAYTEEFWKATELNLFGGVAIYVSFCLSFEFTRGIRKIFSSRKNSAPPRIQES